MVKEKKIGIRYYLNKRLNPQILKGESHYPVYVQLTYDRKSSQFLFPLIHKSGYLTDQEFDLFFSQRKNADINQQIELFEDHVTKIIRFEVRILGNRYHLKGFSAKLHFYQQPILEVLEKYLIHEMKCFAINRFEAENIEDLTHEIWNFAEIYYLIEENYFPFLENVLDLKIKSRIAAYINYLAFLSSDDSNEVVSIYHWIDPAYRSKFKDYLLQTERGRAFKHEQPFSPVFRLLDEYPVTPPQAAKCISSISRMIVEIPQ